MGIAFTFGGTGFVLLKDITAKISSEGPSLIIYAGYIFLIGGLFFKIAIVPFHIWAPDVYQGSPSPVAGFMSVAVKASAFPVLIRLMNGVFHSLSPVWEQTIYTFSIITVIWGSLLGIVQEDFKRLLGYSSIVHAGFILIALLNTFDGGKSAAFYIIIYTMMNIGAFGVVTSLSTENAERTSIESLRGLFTRDPFIAFMLLIFAFSLAGIPPTAGFWAKFYVFKSAIGAGYILPVIILLLGAVVALYYYLKVLIYSFFYSPSNNEPLEKRWVLRLSLLLLSIKILYFGIYPNHLIKFLSISPFAILGK
jgi:NADH-quinone oxidoreductase subunit N